MQWRVGESGEQAWVQEAEGDNLQRRTVPFVVVLGVPPGELRRCGRLMAAVVQLELAAGACLPLEGVREGERLRARSR